MGWSAIASSRTTQSGSFLSQVATGVNTAVDVDTGSITAAGNWTGALDGQAFAIIRAGAVIAVRCIKSFTTTTLTYYRLYLDDDSELATDVQVGDTITLYEQPELVGAGTALSGIAGITLTATGAGEQLFRRYAVGNNGFTITGLVQIPSKHLMEFGATAPSQTIGFSAGGRLAVGWYRTRGGETVFNRDLILRGTKAEGGASNINNSLLAINNATGRYDWFGGGEESGSTFCDVAGATVRIYSKNAWTRGLGQASEQYQIRATSTDWITYGFTSENRSVVLVGNASFGGYAPRQQFMGFSFASVSPSNVWITIINPELKAGNSLDVAFWSSKWARIINNATGSDAIVGGNTAGVATQNKGLQEWRAEVVNVDLTIKNVAGEGIDGRVFCRDNNNGNRLAANQVGTNPDYTADRTYESAVINGAFSFTTDGGVLVACAYQNIPGASVTRFDAITWDYRGVANANTDRFVFALAAYGYIPATTEVVLKGVGGVTVPYTMLSDSGVTASKATAATYTDRFSIDASGNVTVTASATLDELYDYSKWWLEQSGANMEAAGLGSKLIAFSGAGLSMAHDITVDVGATLSSGTKYSGITTTGTLTINGTMAVGSYTSPAGSFVGITVTGQRDGTHVRVTRTDTDAELAIGLSASGRFFFYTQYTTDIPIRADTAYVNGLDAEAEASAQGTLTANGAALSVTQVPCPIYEGNGIDGADVDLVLDGPNIEADADELDNELTVQEFYAWYKWMLMDDDGMRLIFGAVTPQSSRKYIINAAIAPLKVHNKDTTHTLMITGGVLQRSDGASIRKDGDPAVYGSIEMLPDDVYETARAEATLLSIDARLPSDPADQSAVEAAIAAIPAAPSAATNATAVRAELAAELANMDAPVSDVKAKTDGLTFTVPGHLDANIQYVNDIEVKGVGSENDPWNPA